MDFEEWSEETEAQVNEHSLRILRLRAGQEKVAQERTEAAVPGHYTRAETLAKLLQKFGKDKAALYLQGKLPTKQNLQSGDLGEIFASEFIAEKTEYSAPIKKLWWRDNRDWPMKGDDVIAICPADSSHPTRFLKVEAKSNEKMNGRTISEARKALDQDNGLPSPHALSFVADRLAEIGEDDLSDQVFSAQLGSGISLAQAQNMIFTFTGNDTEQLLLTDLESFDGTIKQSSVGLVMPHHQDFIKAIYKAISGDDGS